MITAIDEKGIKVIANKKLNPNGKFYCPLCNDFMFLKITSHSEYFEHMRNINCNYDNTDTKCKWHKDSQNMFHIRDIDFVLDINGIKRIADVYGNKYVIEIQDGSISKETFNYINDFYKAGGYKVIWIINLIKIYSTNKLYSSQHSDEFYWSCPKKYISDLTPQKDNDVFLFLQIVDADGDKEKKCLKRVTHVRQLKYTSDKFINDYKCIKLSKTISYNELKSNMRNSSIHNIV